MDIQLMGVVRLPSIDQIGYSIIETLPDFVTEKQSIL